MIRCYVCRYPFLEKDTVKIITSCDKEIFFCWRCAEERAFHEFSVQSVREYHATKKESNNEWTRINCFLP